MRDQRRRHRELRWRALLKYGFTTNYVTGLDLVLPDGSEVSLGGRELDHPGLDLIGAFVAGVFRIATRIWLRVVPKPETVRTLVAFFGSAVAAGEVVSIVSAGIYQGAMKMMDNLWIRAPGGDQRRLPDRRRRRPGCRTRRLGGRVRSASTRWSRSARAVARTPCAWLRTRPSKTDLENAQGGLCGNGSHHAQLLHPFGDPQDAAGGGAAQDRRAGQQPTCRSRTSSMRATAISTRSSVTTAPRRARPSRPRSSRG